MGEVYRARDTKLNRDVALKVLPELVRQRSGSARAVQARSPDAGLAESPEHRARSTGSRKLGRRRCALVMELVEGDDARGAHRSAAPHAARLTRCRSRGRSPTRSKPRTSRASSTATSSRPTSRSAPTARSRCWTSAWRRRSTRPVDAAGAGTSIELADDHLAARMTQQGMILGTAAYMAPEQAKGKPVDKRADIWAFGVVLYEMLTGQPLFKGERCHGRARGGRSRQHRICPGRAAARASCSGEVPRNGSAQCVCATSAACRCCSNPRHPRSPLAFRLHHVVRKPSRLVPALAPPARFSWQSPPASGGGSVDSAIDSTGVEFAVHAPTDTPLAEPVLDCQPSRPTAGDFCCSARQS